MYWYTFCDMLPEDGENAMTFLWVDIDRSGLKPVSHREKAGGHRQKGHRNRTTWEVAP
jgi:hypothetical protein